MRGLKPPPPSALGFSEVCPVPVAPGLAYFREVAAEPQIPRLRLAKRGQTPLGMTVQLWKELWRGDSGNQALRAPRYIGVWRRRLLSHYATRKPVRRQTPVRRGPRRRPVSPRRLLSSRTRMI